VTARVATLGDICQFNYGRSLPASEREAGDTKVYGSNGPVGTHVEALLSGPAIVVGRKGSYGEVHYCEGSLWPIDTTYYIDANSTECNLRWLHYLLKFLPLTTLNKSAAVPGLNREDAYRLPVLVPTIAEQRRIALVLDKADALCCSRKRSIRLFETLTQSLFLEMFGDPAHNPKNWERGHIGDLVEGTQYGTSGKAGEVGEYPILRMGNITADGRMIFEDIKYIDLDVKHVDRFTVRRGDILFNRTNSAELVGKTSVFDSDKRFAFAGYLVRARAKKGISPYYISGYLNSPHGKAILRGMAKSIVGMANINAKEMQSIPILIPDSQTQEVYARRLSSIEMQRREHGQNLTLLQELFSSLEHSAFAGESA
jgi:type I restriction enzyme, S subunit